MTQKEQIVIVLSQVIGTAPSDGLCPVFDQSFSGGDEPR